MMPRRRQSQVRSSPANRVVRIFYAGIAICGVRWVLSPVFPYLGPDFYVEQWLGAPVLSHFPSATWVVGVANAVSYALLGLAVYGYPLWNKALWRMAPVGEAAVLSPLPATRRPTTLLVCLVTAALVLLAYRHRFLVDDAFISFRYASNFARGHGLVFNPGERVEGYTNFLWVLILTAGIRIGVDPEVCSQFLGLACYAGTLLLTYQMARIVLPGAGWAIATVLLVGTNFTVLSFATSGLETSLQTFLLTAGCWLMILAHGRREWRPRDLLALSLIISAGILTRMDFAVFGAVLVPAAMISIFVTHPHTTHQDLRGLLSRRAAMLLCPILLVVATWLAWKLWYYQSILPNTYYAKRPSFSALRVGADYLWTFCVSYHFVFPVLVVIIGFVQLVRERHVLLAGALIIMFWTAYVVSVGGDFIEFRFLTPILPLFMLCLVWAITRFSPLRKLYLHCFILAWVAYGSLHHARTYTWNDIDPVPNPLPAYHLRRDFEEGHWAEAGRVIGGYFAGDDVVLATTAAGMLPYYSGLRTLDMHGLCDKYIARFGKVVRNRPGHQRIASFDYLKRYGANLVIDLPRIRSVDDLDNQSPGALDFFTQLRPLGQEAIIVAIPITQRKVLMAWYLTPHPTVDREIASNKWRLFHVPTDANAPGVVER